MFKRQKPKIFDVCLLTTVQTPQFRQMTRNSKAKWMMFTILFNNIKKKSLVARLRHIVLTMGNSLNYVRMLLLSGILCLILFKCSIGNGIRKDRRTVVRGQMQQLASLRVIHLLSLKMT